MEMNGEYRINALRQTVWDALNDPEVLKNCIPGCQSLEKTSDTEMNATVVSKIGPVKATFKGSVNLLNRVPPESYTISGEGKGGVAGFAKGEADVVLTEDGEATVLNYKVNAQVGGKIAQLGSRLIDTTAKKMAEEFFGKFAEHLSPSSTEDIETGDSFAEGERATTSSGENVSQEPGNSNGQMDELISRGRFGGPMVWGIAALVLVILGILVFGD